MAKTPTSWYHGWGMGYKEGRTAWMNKEANRLDKLTGSRVDYAESKMHATQDLAGARQELIEAKQAYFATTKRGRAIAGIKSGAEKTWNGVKAPFKWTGKKVGWTAAIVGGVGALAVLSSQSKKAREFDPRTEPLPENSGSDMPQVLSADAAPARTQREVLGPMTAKVLGRSGGLDVSSPNTVGGDGASLIDGKPVKDLGSATPSLS